MRHNVTAGLMSSPRTAKERRYNDNHKIMSKSQTNYWDDLTQWFSFGMHRLLYIPACCIRAIENELTMKHGESKVLHRPPDHLGHNTANFQTANYPLAVPETHGFIDHPHICRGCDHDIVSRAKSSLVHEHTRHDNESFHNWLSNDEPRLDVYKALPRASGYEQNLAGFSDEHLQRVEKYWAEHQLVSPNCTGSAKLATSADWERTKQLISESGPSAI